MSNNLNPIERVILRKYMNQFLKSHWPAIASVVTVVMPFLLPSIKAYIASNPHATLAVLLSAVVAAYYAQSPVGKNGNGPNTPPTSGTGQASKVVMILLALCLFSLHANAQTKTPPPAPQLTNIYAAGISYNNGASPAVAGTALYARALTDNSGTYAFTVFDALPQATTPFTVNTNIGVGVAQKAVTIGKVNFYIPTSAGISFTGSNTGWAWSTGGMAAIKVNSKYNFFLCPNVRVLKSSVNNNSGYVPVVGLMLGWGN